VTSRESDIDRRYGLEPVIEIGAAAGSDALEQFMDQPCPYCGEIVDLRLDLSGGSQSYVEDCQVCCQPMRVIVELGNAGEVESVNLERM
jgi:Cysteine-rich CPXCG